MGDLTVSPSGSGAARGTTVAVARSSDSAAGKPGGLARLLAVPVWSDEDVAASRLRVENARFVTVGGGLASFAVVDVLRVCRVPVSDIRVISTQRQPYANLRYLIRSSQLSDSDPLRSDSMSRIGNIWGFPSYALERAMRKRSVRPLWSVLCEPVAAEFFTPSAAEVFTGVDREASRIGWQSMLFQGQADLLRRRSGGGYFTLVRPGDGTAPHLLRSDYLHIGTGHSAVGYPPEIRDYRLTHNDPFRVVNAYEPHEHVYQVLRRRPGTVLVRGAGITASRVLQRLLDDRVGSGQDVRILHVFRTYTDGPRGPWRFRRPGGDGWAFQAFNYPKAAGAGQLRQPLLKMDGAERAAFITSMGGATTARRRHWQRQLREARAVGCYQAVNAEIRKIEPAAGQRVRIRTDSRTELEADFMIDCAGLRLAPHDNPLLASLLDDGGAGLNLLGGLNVGPHFEVRGADSEHGRVYASGVITRGGYLAPVDSFWGFSHAAMLICDDLAHRGFCARLGLARSVTGWFRWLARQVP
jgi:hypothetical protein